MENKKLIKILTKDMRELEELIAEIKISGKYNQMEIEFLHARAKGVLSLIELFVNQGEDAPSYTVETENQTVKAVTTKKVEADLKEEIEEEVELKKRPKDEVKVAEESTEEEHEEKLAEKTPDPEIIGESQPETVEENQLNDLDEDVSIDNMEPEDEEHTTLGDTFTSEKSLNDIISESKKRVQDTISNRPVSSLQSAVGINDRFLFIRELFEGNGDHYGEAVKKLDGMNSINEAVPYLRDNFKWKKNETSLKFIELVKRRFADG